MLTVEDIVEVHISLEIQRLQEENELLKGWIKSNVDSPTCAVCQTPIENVSIQRMLRPYLWCSRKCFEFKPRKIIKLERKYGMDITTILQETTRTYGNIKAQCDALGISIPYFYSIIHKYCGNQYVEFMATYAIGKRKETYAKKIEKGKKDNSFEIGEPCKWNGIRSSDCSKSVTEPT
jgi:hypothetical protein